MNLLKPPYTKKHIIILASITFFTAIGFLFLTKYQSVQDLVEATITPQQVRQEYEEPLKIAVEEDPGKAWSAHDFLILDVRPNSEYLKSHIKGSLSAPVEFIDKNMYSPDDTIIIYSQNQLDLSKAKQALSDMGVTKVEVLNNTLDELKDDGYEIVAN